MKLTVINDWHIGAIRSAGTTPATAYQLRQDLLRQLEELLNDVDTELLINGDLFDGPNIPKPDMLRTFQILSNWLARTGKGLILSNGNHDLSKSSTEMSSFQLLCALLKEVVPEGRVVHVEEPLYFPAGDFMVIPHLANQDLFNVALEQVPPTTEYLFVHCNYDNGFAEEKDHSLNMSEEQARACPARFIVFGHEHQGGTHLDSKVIIVGNQVPSSVSDCLGNTAKRLLHLDGTGTHWAETWCADGDYSEQDWRELKDEGRFIRVVGDATASEAPKAMLAIAKFRAKAQALVITNAVRIEGVSGETEFEMTHEQITEFNVREALREFLTDKENAKVDALLAPAAEQEKAA